MIAKIVGAVQQEIEKLMCIIEIRSDFNLEEHL
jgi:hypothetical protein